MEFTPKKEIAKQFLLLITGGEIDKAFANYVGSNFKHHHPFYLGQAADLKDFLREEAQRNPHKILKNLRVIEQNDLVMTHSLVKNTPDDLGTLVVYIFRFENHLITEFWEVQQAIPPSMINENGMV
ncbi:nuclear transport factor 2 family protein [Flavobacterium sp. JP2137]|uniref:nuclear transport factor 2 family protein n=1 Tax=Flavobacterium sp. JP2137 TaxID=3414510 RepID=UPI003D2FDA2C